MSKEGRPLGLRAGEFVEVRSVEEILATLDEKGRYQGLPFMPEMLPYCGKRLQVSKRADKTCDPAHAPWSLRRLKNVVHLEDLRCDGCEHGGCEAGCRFFWEEAWLRRVESNLIPVGSLRHASGATERLYSIEPIYRACRHEDAEGQAVYACQATELRNYSSHLPGWDLRQYVRDLRSGNLFSEMGGKSRSERPLEILLAVILVIRTVAIDAFNNLQKKRHGVQFPYIEGANRRTPVEKLELQPGELVEVLSKEEIMETLDGKNCNRGLLFDGEMLRYCGGIYRVLRRVHRIIDEKTGKMLQMKNPCIVLEGVFCQSEFHRLCPRAIPSYWRENWLKRAVAPVAIPAEEPVTQGCENC